MDFTDPRAVFGTAWLVIQAALAVPLIVRLMRTPSRTGFSLVGEALWVVAGIGWIAYGIGSGSVTLIISGSLAAVTSAVVVLLVARAERAHWAQAFWWSLSGAAAMIAMTLGWGVEGLSAALAVFGAVQFLPQIRESVDHLRRGTALPGVSALGVGARAFYTLGWAVYGAGPVVWGAGTGHVDWPLIGWGLTGAVAFGLLAVVAVPGRKKLATA